MRNVTVMLFLGSLALTCACGSYSSPAPADSAAPAATSAHLVDGSGRTIYEYSGDIAGSGVSNCTSISGCITAWPAVPGGEAISATSGGIVQQASVSSFTRSNPSGSQATYEGKPLYYFVDDTSAGEATGNGVDGFTLVAP